MTPKELASAALNHDALDAAERIAYLRDACSGDEALFDEALDIMNSDEAMQAAFSTATMPGVAGAAIGVIGNYVLIRRIGAGGMGVVYHARQTQPLRRDVALKVIKPGMDSRQVIARFESERQALALMDHPNIARVFDAGATNQNLPYFVMELVDGVPITDFCNRNHLDVRSRIELFIPVCEAIQHAHQKGIIHRDIKPSNVLVGQPGSNAIAKVIDFGLAKALSGSLTDASVMTQFGAVVGTFDYMSPEQAELGRLDVDTRADIYALGALLYELLTGAAPLEYDRASKPSYVQLLTWIREKPIQPPSQRIKEAGHKTARLDRELDWIAMKALEKDRTRRYETANALVRDLQRYLLGEPVEAGPPSTWYKLRKAAVKYRWPLAITSLFIAMLAAAVGVSTSMAVRARQAESEARAVNNFLRNDVLAQAGASAQAQPDIKPDAHLEVRTALDRAAARIDGEFHDQPLVEASVRETIGESYLDLGLLAEAERQLKRAFDLRQAWLGKNHRDTLETRRWLANVQLKKGEYSLAEAQLRELFDLERRRWGEEDAETLTTMGDLADVYQFQGKYALSQPLATKILDSRRRVFGPDHPETLAAMNSLAMTYDNTGRYGEAEALLKQALQQRRRVSGDEHPQTLLLMHNLAGVYRDEARFQDSEALLERSLEISRRVSGEEHPETLVEANNLALVYIREGKYSDAERLLSNTLAIRRRVSGDDHPETLTVMNNLAIAKENLGRFIEAEKLYAETLNRRDRVSGEGDPNTINAMQNLGMVLYDQGKYDAAESWLARAIALRTRAWGEEDPLTLWYKSNLAVVYEREGKAREAQSLFEDVLVGRRRVLGDRHADTLRTQALLGRLHLRQRRYLNAERELSAALESYRTSGSETWQRYHCEALVGWALAALQRNAEAEGALRSGNEGLLRLASRIGAANWRYFEESEHALTDFYIRQRKPELLKSWTEEMSTNATVSAMTSEIDKRARLR